MRSRRLKHDSGSASRFIFYAIALVVIGVLFYFGREYYLKLNAQSRAKNQAALIAGQMNSLVDEYKKSDVGYCDKDSTGITPTTGRTWCHHVYYFEVPPGVAADMRFHILDQNWDEDGGDMSFEYEKEKLVCHFYPDGEKTESILKDNFKITDPEYNEGYIYTFLRCDAQA
jgi:hypothetical protein